jgi:hypothetical protein
MAKEIKIVATAEVKVNGEDQVKSLTKALRDAEDAVKVLDELSVDPGTEDYEKAKKAVKDLNLELALVKTPEGLVEATRQVKTFQDALIGLDPASDEFKKISSKLAAVKDSISDVKELAVQGGGALERAGNQGSAAFSKLASGDISGAADSLKLLAGNLKEVKFGDIKKGVADFGSAIGSVGKALLTNPIFLIGAAIAAIIVNFEKLTQIIPGFGKGVESVKDGFNQIKFAIGVGINPELEKSKKLNEEKLATSKKEFDQISATEETLKAQGLTEEQILELKREKLVADVVTLQNQLLIQKQEEQGLIESRKRLRDYVDYAAEILLIPFTAPIKVVEFLLIGLEKLGAVSQETVDSFKKYTDVGGAISEFFVGTDADIEKSVKDSTKATEDALVQAQNSLDGINNQAKAKAKQEAEAARAEAKQRADENRKALEDALKTEQELRTAAIKDEEQRAIQESLDKQKLTEDSLQKQLNAIKGNSDDEVALRKSLQNQLGLIDSGGEEERTNIQKEFSDKRVAQAEDEARKRIEVEDNLFRLQKEAERALAKSDGLTLEEQLGFDAEDLAAAYDAKFELAKGNVDAEIALQKAFEAESKDLNDKYLQAKADADTAAREKAKADEEAAFQLRIETATKAISTISSVVDSFSSINSSLAEKQTSELEARQAKELENFKGTAEEKEKLEKKLDEEKDKLAKKQFERDKKFRIAQALIAGAQGVMQNVAQFGIPAAIPFIALTAGVTAAQVAAIKAQQFNGGGSSVAPPSGGGSSSEPQPLQLNQAATVGGFTSPTQQDIKVSVYESDILRTREDREARESKANVI